METLNFIIESKIETLEDFYKEVQKQLQTLEITADKLEVSKRLNEKGYDWSVRIETDSRRADIYSHGNTATICIVQTILECLKYKFNPKGFKAGKLFEDETN